MKNGQGRINASYNCQAAMTAEQVIVSSEVITDPTDRNALELMVKTTDRNLSEHIKEVTADSGYASYDNYEYLVNNDKVGYIPDQYLRQDLANGLDPYHQDNFHYDQQRDQYQCPTGNILTLYRIRRKDYGYREFQIRIYKGHECRQCGQKSLCTTQQQRTVTREDRKELLEQMRARLLTTEGQKKYNQRMWTTEPVFGHLKYNLGYRQFLLRTLAKVKGEFRLMCIGYNLKKMNTLIQATG